MSSAAQQEFDELVRDKEKRSNHPEDRNGRQYTNGADEQRLAAEEFVPRPAVPRTSMNSGRDKIPITRYGANTGPKGVISDAQQFRDERRQHRAASKNSMASVFEHEQAPNLRQQLAMERLNLSEEHGNLEEDDEHGDLDDDFMVEWRAKRMAELQSSKRSQPLGYRTKARYGTISTVDDEGYLFAIEKSPKDTVVVVYIYDDMVGLKGLWQYSANDEQSSVSQLFETCLRTIATQHSETRFVRFHYQDAEIQAAGVPAIIAYQNAERIAALVPVLNEMPDDADLNAITLEKLLQK